MKQWLATFGAGLAVLVFIFAPYNLVTIFGVLALLGLAQNGR